VSDVVKAIAGVVPDEFTIPSASSIAGYVNQYAGLFPVNEITILTGQDLIEASPGLWLRAVNVGLPGNGGIPNRAGYTAWVTSTTGKDLTATGIVRTWLNGITRNWLTLSVVSSYTPPGFQIGSTYVTGYDQAPGYKSLSTTLAGAHNTGAAILLDWYMAAGDTTPDIGKTISLIPPIVTVPGNGKIIYPLGIGGWVIEGFLDSNIVGMDTWIKLLSLYVGKDRVLFWIDIGTNGTYFTDQSDLEKKLKKLIGLCRIADSTADILLTTAHPANGQVAGYEGMQGTINVSKKFPGVCCIDTWTASPSYAAAVTAGDMADDVHYNVQGNQKWYTRLNSLIAS
jgi:hypothetical protein